MGDDHERVAKIDDMGATMPSEMHELAIDDACDNHGFCRHSFVFFCKVVAALGIIKQQYDESLFDPMDLFDSLRGHKCSTKAASIKAGVERLIGNHRASVDGDLWIEDFERLSAFDKESGSYKNLSLVVSRLCNFIPDAWRFDKDESGNMEITVLEVTDSHPVSLDVLRKAALMQDIVFYNGCANLFLFEKNLRAQSIISHNLPWVFDHECDDHPIISDWWDDLEDRDKFRAYLNHGSPELATDKDLEARGRLCES